MIDDEIENEMMTNIDISDEQNLMYWTRIFNCSRENLIKAVLEVGTNISKVDTFLVLNRMKND